MNAAALLAVVVAAGPLAAQSRPDLYDCEGCEAIHEHSFTDLSWSTVIAAPGEPGDRMILSGRVFLPDGTTPAAGIVVYIHHTNAAGIYPMRGDEQGWGRRHGYLRGWARTNAAGEYRFETIRPGAYPGRRDPQHVHYTIKEPDRREYWIEEVIFSDDPLVTSMHRTRDSRNPRGGPGLVTPTRDAAGTWIVRRDITLER
jgi:protocatechuate 3,4-dioxygenase beta subunit